MSEIRSGGIQGILPVPVQVLDKPRTAKFGHWREMTFYASAQYRGIHLWLTYFGSPGADGVQREDWVGELEDARSVSLTGLVRAGAVGARPRLSSRRLRLSCGRRLRTLRAAALRP
jgi:hypothetical protein